MAMTNDELIQRAASVMNPRITATGNQFGTVAATLVTDKGSVYDGACIDTACSMGFCVEHAAIAAMVTAGNHQIATIVAVGRDERSGDLYVLPPCGRCREFIRQIDEANLETDVVLDRAATRKLEDLLPFHAWPVPLETA
jgi:cytidine deaminase